ncbi:PadR family transcriptional regulator [Clostridium uliginosum]|uniref:Transcriptional regulator PadR-like family protein n=1 Tax=Clostridium uliginosum TaxID=119641 RepID=A0A1I1I6N4_9CLOT|nr:PadR family transcriptional regulator [Clostridium uliginosum]SFC32089.1 Transcriptional regulator PadR-like family protein [Clostridium uliginosum]
MKKEELIKEAINKNLENKELILKNILNTVREEEKINSQKEDLNVLILSLIKRKDMYGYGVIKELEIKSRGTFSMQEGEIYPILHLSEEQGFLESYWKIEDDNIEKKYYRLTKQGKTFLKNNAEGINNIRMLKSFRNLEKIT